MIKIDINLFVTLFRYLPEDIDSEQFEISDNTNIGQLIDELGIPDDLIKLIFVNGRKQDRRYLLQNRDRLGLFPPVGGG